ncbi:MAG: PIN/TRAM domain-containing protein [Chloroflexota bacterium]
MSADFLLRLLGMVVLAVVGWQVGESLDAKTVQTSYRFILILSLSGAALGLLLTPYFTSRPFLAIRRQIRRMPAQQLIAAIIGLIIGLVVAALLAIPIGLLPPPIDALLSFSGVIVFSYLGVAIMVMRRQDIFNLLGSRRMSSREGGSSVESTQVLLDTSVIIDGRIADVSRTGFIQGTMMVPRFVLNELQHIADSADALRRNRGRRGLEMLNKLQKDSTVPILITDMDIDGVREVDDKLVLLAKQLHCAIVTNDYNLNRVAELQGVTVLNINELANAVRAIFLPGETLEVKVIQEGKELGQGVGYLDDGTMVVVEEGRRDIGRVVPLMVTKVLQTAAGRMIFARRDTDAG